MINWIIFIVASAVLISVGVWSNQRIKKARKTGEGFLLGGKQIGAFVGAGTLMATGYSGWGFIGSPGTAYAYGTIEVLANFFFAPAIVFGTLWFAGFMRRQADKCGGLTVPEYLTVTHRGSDTLRRTVHFIAGTATFVFLSVYMIGQIRAVGLVASEWLGISEILASALLMAVIVVFTMQGGLLAVAVTDTIMCIGMLVASIIVYVTIIRDIPMMELISAVGKLNSEFINPTTSVPYGNGMFSVFLVFIYALLFTTTLPYMSVRFLSFKEDIKIHTMALIMAPMGFILSLIPLVGIYMYYKNPNLANPDSAMPVFLNTFLPPFLTGFITLFILFAMLSTISSVLQALASALSYDMFVSIANRNSNRGDLINRIGVLVIAIWVMFLTFMAPQGMLNQIAYIGTGGLISAFVGPIIMRVFVEADLRACLASLLVGFLGNVFLVFKMQVGWVEAPIIAGLAGSVVYLIMGYINNGGARKPKDLIIN
jgi:Na+/proline symporter